MNDETTLSVMNVERIVLFFLGFLLGAVFSFFASVNVVPTGCDAACLDAMTAPQNASNLPPITAPMDEATK